MLSTSAVYLAYYMKTNNQKLLHNNTQYLVQTLIVCRIDGVRLTFFSPLTKLEQMTHSCVSFCILLAVVLNSNSNFQKTVL